MLCARSFLVVAAITFPAIAHAQPTGAAVAVAVVRENEQYVIRPGVEPVLSDMLGSGQTLPGGCTFTNGRIERTYVLATYTCDSGSVVLQLLHPELAPPEDVRTHRFAMTVKSGAPPPGLLDTLAKRIRAREASFEWTDLGAQGLRRKVRWAVRVAAGALLAILAFWVVRPLTIRRRAAK